MKKKTYLIVDKQPLAGSTFINWMRVLIENKFDIDWGFISRAIYVTLMIIAMIPLRLIEKRKFGKKIKEKIYKEWVFCLQRVWVQQIIFYNSTPAANAVRSSASAILMRDAALPTFFISR